MQRNTRLEAAAPVFPVCMGYVSNHHRACRAGPGPGREWKVRVILRRLLERQILRHSALPRDRGTCASLAHCPPCELRACMYFTRGELTACTALVPPPFRRGVSISISDHVTRLHRSAQDLWQEISTAPQSFPASISHNGWIGRGYCRRARRRSQQQPPGGGRKSPSRIPHRPVSAFPPRGAAFLQRRRPFDRASLLEK